MTQTRATETTAPTTGAAHAATSADVREHIIEALRLDLIGPRPDDPSHAAYERETLPSTPSQWYLTGFLAPRDAPLDEKTDDDVTDQLDVVGDLHDSDDDGTPEAAAARRASFASSIGLSVLVPAGLAHVDAHLSWGEYKRLRAEKGEGTAWLRAPREQQVRVDLTTHEPIPVPGSNGLELTVATRPVETATHVPPGTRSVSVFVVNRRRPAPDVRRDEAFIFQARLALQAEQPFVPRPDPRGHLASDWDEQVADLQYSDAVEHVVGHNVSATATLDPDGACRNVRTTWMPRAEIEKVVPNETIANVELGLEALAAAPNADAARSLVGGLTVAYGAWIASQPLPADAPRRKVAESLLADAKRVRGRIEAGLAALDDPLVFEAFRIANRTVARAIRQRACHDRADLTPETAKPPRWRPFQLAFLLTNLAGVAVPDHPDREIVDLLFFPTGGGKTEAYLGLAAFVLALRRLRDPSVHSSGVSVLMRYTLRLLTLDQLGRAATLMCALELERRDDVTKLGTWPFEIGLWVGQAATPNRMGKKGDNDSHSARSRTIAFQNDSARKPSPIPLENCPWCGARFTKDSFVLRPNASEPTELRCFCTKRDCLFNARNSPSGLPVLAIDEPIYRRVPAFLIATVDKFASLPWVGQSGALFGKVERHDDEGFYGPADKLGRGKPLERPLPPPDLVIQDELHLISGPLGTMAGLYETAIEALCAQGGRRPKIVASTATVRRAQQQIRGLFGRPRVDVFPPPGPDRRDSFFALTRPASACNPRVYLGVAAHGRNIKVVFLRALLGLLGAAQKDYLAAAPGTGAANPADPYMTCVTYFNTLRELGGSRRIVEDEVHTRVGDYGRRRLRVGERDGRLGNRPAMSEPCELTSRVSTNEVADTKRRLALPFTDKQRVDVALATNMISVGLDITRLGLMVVMGQPKTASEYIQATSRVGRDDQRPGLVLTLLNLNRHRDRSHYERFEAWHACFYRAVEATSVTPFSPRAIERGLAGVVVALARHGLSDMTAPRQAAAASPLRAKLDFVADEISRRAEGHDARLDAAQAEALRKTVKEQVNDLLDTWAHIANGKTGNLQYARETGVAPPLLYDPLDQEVLKEPREARKFRVGRSLRDVEPSVALFINNPDDYMWGSQNS